MFMKRAAGRGSVLVVEVVWPKEAAEENVWRLGFLTLYDKQTDDSTPLPHHLEPHFHTPDQN